MRKQTVLISAAVLVAAQLVFTGVASPATAATSASNMSDADFFGSWNATSQTWTTAPRLDYAGFAGLAPVQTAVKAGDYAQAETALEQYMHDRAPRVAPNTWARNTTMVPLLMDDILTPQKQPYITTFSVGQATSTQSVDVLAQVTAAMQSDKQVPFMLRGRVKGSAIAQFYSRDQDCSTTTVSGCKPTLHVTYSDATGSHTADVVANMDTFIRGNDATTHGTEPLIQVEDSGQPFDSNTREGYLKFDLSSVDGTVSQATLKLSGSASGTSPMQVMLYQSGDSTWDENTLTYANHQGKTFSWQGNASGSDWVGPTPPIADVEYGYQLDRFLLLEPLISEYIATGDEQYATKYLGDMTDFIADADATTSTYGSGSYPRSLDTALRAVDWVKAFEVLRTSASMNPVAETDVLKTMWKTATYLMSTAGYHPSNNWGVFESQALFYISEYFPELAGSSTWQSTSQQRLDYLISSLNYPDGSYTESSTDYAAGTTGNFLDVKQFGQFNGITFSSTFDQKLHAMGTYLMNMAFPDGNSPNFGDGGSSDMTQVVGSVANTYNDPELTSFATHGQSGTVPAHTSVLYPNSNIGIMRSGWTPQDNYLFINTKQDPSHRHPDDNAVTVYGKGRALLVDPGAYTYNSDPVSNWLRKSTDAHNTITINGAVQNTSPGYLDDWSDNSRFDFAEGVTGSTPGFTHHRDVLFLKSSYSIVSDYVESTSGTNTYEQNWHFLPQAAPAIDSTTKATRTNFGDSLGDIQVVPADPGQETASLKSGYYSGATYSVAPANYASYTKTATGDVTFDTVLYPTASGDTRTVTTTRIPVSPQVPTTVASALSIGNIGAAGTTGYYYVSHDDLPGISRGFSTLTTDGKAAYAEKSSGGTVTTAVLKTGTTLTDGGNSLIRSNRVIDNVAVDWNGSTLEINGSGLVPQTTATGSAVGVRASGITTVKLNGQVVPFAQANGMIYAAGVSTWNSSTGFTATHDLGVGHTGVQSIQFDVTANANQIGGLIGYGAEQSTATAEGDVPAIVRLNSAGTFDVRDGATYHADAAVPYVAGGVYHVTLLADVDSGTYDVYVASHGQPEVQIADHYAFNSSAAKPADLGRVFLSAAAGLPFDVSNHTAGAAESVQVQVSADATVNASSPTTNYSTGSQLEVRNSTSSGSIRQAYLKFDLSTVASNAAFAKLSLTSATTGTFTDQVQSVADDSWQESGITWANKPAAGAVLATWQQPAASGTVTTDLTNQVNAELTGDKTLSLMVSSQTQNNVSHYYYSKEKGSGIATLQIYTKRVSGATVAASADAFVYAGAATTNYGTGTNLEIRSSTSSSVQRLGFVKFDLSKVTGTVASAKLRLTSSICTGGPFTDQAQFVSDDSWTESGITFNTEPAVGAQLGSWTMPDCQKPIDIDVTQQVAAELAGDKTLSIALSSLTQNNVSHYYFSRESGQGPQLLITTN